MYFKVALIFILGLFFSGCSFNKAPKPRVTKVESNVTLLEDNSTIIPIKDTKVVEKKESKYNLKPEPFSLENNEEDPELLGPQSTLDNGLNREDDETDENSENKKPIKNSKKDIKKEEKL